MGVSRHSRRNRLTLHSCREHLKRVGGLPRHSIGGMDLLAGHPLKHPLCTPCAYGPITLTLAGVLPVKMAACVALFLVDIQVPSLPLTLTQFWFRRSWEWRLPPVNVQCEQINYRIPDGWTDYGPARHSPPGTVLSGSLAGERSAAAYAPGASALRIRPGYLRNPYGDWLSMR